MGEEGGDDPTRRPGAARRRRGGSGGDGDGNRAAIAVATRTVAGVARTGWGHGREGGTRAHDCCEGGGGDILG